MHDVHSVVVVVYTTFTLQRTVSPAVYSDVVHRLFPLVPGQLHNLLVFEGGAKCGAIEVDEHNTVALGVPE